MRRLAILAALLCLLCSAFADESDTIKRQLLTQLPPVLADLVHRFPDEPASVDFLRADLDGSGNFQYLVAFYSQESSAGVFLRVFKQEGSQLQLVGEQDDTAPHGGFATRLSLVDINADGIPEILLESTEANGRQIFDELMVWTGRSLHSAISYLPDASPEDIDSDGILELISHNENGTYNIYKFNGTDFKLLATVDHDPDGAFAADGKPHIVRAFLKKLRPSRFALEEIRNANRKDNDNIPSSKRADSGERVRFIIGNLRDLKGNAIPVDQIDTNTLVFVRNLHPLASSIRAAGNDDDGDNRKPNLSVLELEFARVDFLRLLPHLKLTAPLASGDKLTLLLFGKLRNGDRISASTSVTISGDKSNDDDD